jgi:hypothetical protein
LGLLKKKTNPEIWVYVKQEPIDIVIKCEVKTSSDGLKALVEIEPETELKAGWSVDVTGCIRTNTRGLYCEVIRGATKAIKFDLQNQNFSPNMLTLDEAQRVINMKIFKAHYGSMLKDLLSALKPYLIVMAIVVTASVAISAYNAYELSKIPAIMYPVPTG